MFKAIQDRLSNTEAAVMDKKCGQDSGSNVCFKDLMEIDEDIHNALKKLEEVNGPGAVHSKAVKPKRSGKRTKTSFIKSRQLDDNKGTDGIKDSLSQILGQRARASLSCDSSDLSLDSDWSIDNDQELELVGDVGTGSRDLAVPSSLSEEPPGVAGTRVVPSPPAPPILTDLGAARIPPPPAETPASTLSPRSSVRTDDRSLGKSNTEKEHGIDSLRARGKKAPELDISHSPVKNPRRFFKLLLTAIKNNQICAVDAMCESVVANNVDLSDTSKFTEEIYRTTALHAALLFNRPEIARKLILTCPKLVRIPHTSNYMNGQTCVHIASANNDLALLKFLLKYLGDDERRELLNAQATGTYFKERHPAGALCLTAAIWAGHVDALECLLRYGATMNIAGPSGNTPLHHVVIFSHDHPKRQDRAQLMFELFWKYCDSATGLENCSQKALQEQIETMRRLLQIRNDDGQTPLTLAVNLQAPIAKYLLNFEHLYRQPQTKVCSTALVTYDVTDVTSYGCMEGSWTRYNPRSVLHILAHRAKIVSLDDDNFEDLIEAQPISDLVKMKWNVYQWIYYLWCVIHLAYMITLTWYATQLALPRSTLNGTYKKGPDVTSPTSNLTESVEGNAGNKSSFHWIFSVLPIMYIVFELEDTVVSGFRSFRSLVTSKGYMKTAAYLVAQWTVTGNGPYRVLLMLFSGSVLSWIVLFAVQSIDQDVALSVALMLGWIFMVFFTRGIKATSRFSIMVQKMFFHDLIYFLSVYWFIWIAFSAAMLAIGRHDERNYISVGDTLFHMLNVVTDAGEKATEESARIPTVAAVLLSCYAVISVILLLNMLIAMMNASYDAVSMSKTNLFRYQQLSILLMIERRLFWWRWLCERSQLYLWRSRKIEVGERSPKVDGVDVEMIDFGGIIPNVKYVGRGNRIYAEVVQNI